MAENMRGLNFLLEGKVNEWLAGRTKEEEIDGFMIDDGDSFCIDIIEQPFHCEASAENGAAKLALYVRNELGAYMEPDLSIVIREDNERPEIKRSGRIGGDSTKQLLVFMQAASVLKKYAIRNHFAEQFEDFDTDREVIIVTIEEDMPVFQRVRGKKRPPLSVRTMTGSVELGRPYADELISEYGMSDFESTVEVAEDGNVDAMNEVALAYINGKPEEDVNPDLHKAFYWAKQLANAKEPVWMKRLGLFYASGRGTERDFDEAVLWLRKAAAEGEPEAEKLAAQFAKMSADEKKALEGDSDAMAELAAAYMLVAGSRGETGFEGDYAKSLYWAEKSVEYDSGFGCWVLGLLYEHGRGVDKDLEKAAELYQRGAVLGNREAQNNLGTFLMNGMGVPQDRKQAFRLFKESAKQGYGVAMRNLGNCYQYAYGTDGNMRKAVEWYEKALQVINDPELEQKVKIFRAMGDSDPEWDTDYPEAEEIEQEAEALNGPLKAALKAQGMPTDEEYINSLPAEEVFALLASLENGGKYIPPVRPQEEPVYEPEPEAENVPENVPGYEPEPVQEYAPEPVQEYMPEPSQEYVPEYVPEQQPAGEEEYFEAAEKGEKMPQTFNTEPADVSPDAVAFMDSFLKNELQPEAAPYEEPEEPAAPAPEYAERDEDRLLDEIFAMPDFAEGRDMTKIFAAIDQPAGKEEPKPQEPEAAPEPEPEPEPMPEPEAAVQETAPAEPAENPAEMIEEQDIFDASEAPEEPQPEAEMMPPAEEFIAEEDLGPEPEAPAEPAAPELEGDLFDESLFPLPEDIPGAQEPEAESEPEPEPKKEVEIKETVVAEAKYVIEEIRSPKETDVVVSDIMKDEFDAMIDEVSTFDEKETENLFPEPKEPEPFDERLTEADVRKTIIRNPLYHLTYSKRKSGGNSSYTIALPDGFTGEWNAEGRDFIAWLPWGENVSDYKSSPIAFYAGPETGANNIDTRLLEPAICAILTEQSYWKTERQRLLSEKNRIIVLDETHPAGCIIAGYDEGEFAYNVNIVMPGHIKTMRVQILGADEEDIPDCDRMVLDWVKTLHSDEAFEPVKNLDDSYFSAQPLTEELAAAWKKAGDIRYTILERRYRDTAALCRERFARGAYGVDGEEAFRSDLQNNLNRWAKEFTVFLRQGTAGIEAFRTADPENPLLTALCDVFRPVMETEAERSEQLDDETVLSASVKNIDGIRTRFAKLDAELVEEERLRNLAAFREPLYENPKKITIGGLEGLLPDGMITLAEAEPDAHSDADFLTKLRGIYTMAAIPGDYEGGFDRYTEGAFCVNLGNPVEKSGFGVLFDSETPETTGEHLIQFLTANLKRNNRYNANYPAEYVSGGKNFSIVCAQTEGNADENKRGASFVYLILDNDGLYQGNAYFNSVGKDEQFREAMHTWLKTFSRSETEEAAGTKQFKTADTEPALHTCLNTASAERAEGTDIAYVPVSRLSGDSGIIEAAAEDPNTFQLSETAVRMAELFRVSISSFNPANDREQEIRSGLIRYIGCLHAFRSFVWTLKAYCSDNNTALKDTGMEELEQLADFIADRNFLNYKKDTYFPAACSSDDINVCYLSDSVSEPMKRQFAGLLNKNGNAEFSRYRIFSLDNLRSELEELEPVMRTISDALEKKRNREEPLAGGLADVLYVWCSLACAAKKPFMAAEGPASCHWEHPNAFAQVQRTVRAEKLKDGLVKEYNWLKRYRNVIEKNPDISLKDALFVFTGAAALEEYPAIIARLEEEGGILRNAVSARTDYVVVNPSDAGETKVNAALEQKKNGNPIRIILLNDLRRALGMPEADIRKELEALNVDIDIPEPEDTEPEAEEIRPVPVPEPVRKEEPEEIEPVEKPAEEEEDDAELSFLDSIDLPESFDRPVPTDTELETMLMKAMKDSPLTEDPGILIPDFEDAEKSGHAEAGETPAESTPEDAELEDAIEEAFDETAEEPEESEAAETETAAEEQNAESAEETEPESVAEEVNERPADTEPEVIPAEALSETAVKEQDVPAEAADETPVRSALPETPEAEGETPAEDLPEEASDKTEPEEKASEEPEEPAAEAAEEAPAEETEPKEESEPETETSEEQTPESTPEEAAEKTAEPEEDKAEEALRRDAKRFLKEKEEELKRFRADWDNFSELSSKTLMHKIRAGMKPKLSAEDPGTDRTVRMNLSFDSDTTEVKKFIDTIPEKVDRKKEKLSEGIRSFDEKLKELTEQGLDEITTLKLCRLFTEFKETGRNLSLRFTSRDVHYSIDEEVNAIGKEWEEKYAESKEKLEEAEKNEPEEKPEAEDGAPETAEKQPEPMPQEEVKERVSETARLRFATSKTVKTSLAEEEAKMRNEEQKNRLLNLQKKTEQRIQEQLAEEEAEEQKAKEKQKGILIAAAVILVLLCSLAALYYFSRSGTAQTAAGTDVMYSSRPEYVVSVLSEDIPEDGNAFI